jgi:HPt (histidine-containing phosphotransfer) domain-containing protein
MNETVLEAESSVMDFEALKARCLGNLNLVERVLSKFATQLDSDVDALEQAYRSGDTETFALVAHRIKGMSANVEARSLYDSAVAAERAARANDNDELPTQIERIQRDRDQLAISLSCRSGL